MPLIETKGAASSQGFGQFARTTAATYVEDVFSTWLYTGNGGTQTITNGIDLAGKGGLVWVKSRSNSSTNNLFLGWSGTASLSSNTTDAQNASGYPITRLSNGFSFSDSDPYWNFNGYTYASWTFRKQPKFFDVVTYTGNGTVPRSISHSLASVPGFIVIKCTSAVDNWICRHRSTGDTPNDMTNYVANDRLFLNTTGGAGSSSNIKADASTFTVNHVGDLNTSGKTYVAYLFAHDAGGFGVAGTDNVISCGSFTTDGSGNATVTLGWEPQWMITKSSSQVENWYINDTARGFFATPSGAVSGLSANTTSGEAGTRRQHVTSTGFTVEGGLSANQQYVYIAIRRGPMKVPTSGTSVFGMQTYADATLGSTAPIVLGSSVGFPVDTAISAIRTSGAANINRFWGDRLRGRSELYTTSTAAEGNTDIITWGWQAGVQVSTAGNWYYFNGAAGSRTFASYFFRRAPGFFDVVCYTGDGTSNRNVTHSLGVTPSFYIVKRRSTTGAWWTWAAAFNGGVGYGELNSSGQFGTGTILWGTGSPTSTTFPVSYSEVNSNAGTFVAYLFADCPGVSKAGIYVGTGAAQTINCGFTSGARFVLIKRTTGAGYDWYVWDTARGITAGNDPYLLLNSTAAETTGTDYISVQSSGFGLTATAPAALNANGVNYFFLAIA